MKTFRSKLFHSVPVLLAFASLTACSKKTEPSATPEVVRGVHVFQAATQKLPTTVDMVGTVRPSESSTVSSQVMGTITSIAVREGDRVRAGQILLTIDAAQLSSQIDRAHAAAVAVEQQIAAAESDAMLAASTLKRFEMLKAQKSVSPQEFDEVQSRSQAAAARLAMVRSQLAEAQAAEAAARTMQGYTRIHAPFDGVISQRKVDPGAMASPGSPLLTIEKTGTLRLEISVDESLLSDVRLGTGIPVALDALGPSPLRGKIAQIVPAADPASRSFLVKIDLPSAKNLHSGMFGHAVLQRGTADVLMILRSAVVMHGSMQSVYVIGQNQIASVRYVSTGSSHGSEVEVLSGLSAGESVVDSPGERELSGKRVEVQP
jgi:RND family efflux transporter MFP subunit